MARKPTRKPRTEEIARKQRAAERRGQSGERSNRSERSNAERSNSDERRGQFDERRGWSAKRPDQPARYGRSGERRGQPAAGRGRAESRGRGEGRRDWSAEGRGQSAEGRGRGEGRRDWSAEGRGRAERGIGKSAEYRGQSGEGRDQSADYRGRAAGSRSKSGEYRGQSSERRSQERRGWSPERKGQSAERRSQERRGWSPERKGQSAERRSPQTERSEQTAGGRSWTPELRPQPTAEQRQLSFVELGLPAELTDELASQKIATPFPIQSATIPDALAGRDLLGRGQTGSGKTLAFALPLITRLMQTRRAGTAPRAVILSPTRELAAQIADVIVPLARSVGQFAVLIAGGMSYEPQLRALSRGVDIIVATPGRLIDLTERGAADLSRVQVAVLDEADQMCDMGFLPEVTSLWDQIPSQAQHLLFSATLDADVATLAERYLRSPVEHGVDSGKASVSTMDHQIWTVHPLDKLEIVSQVANREGRTLVFVRTQLEADRVAGWLRERGVLAGSLHGGLRQGARTRVMDAFRRGDLPVLVATDVAARGIHVDDISLVLQADIAHDAKDYLHRAGRTARAGESGRVVSLVAPRQRRQMEQISRQVGVDARPQRVRPGDEILAEVGGEVPGGEAIAERDYQAVISPRRAAGRPGRKSRRFGRTKGRA